MVARAQAGDVRAFEVLVARHQMVALRIAYPLVGSEASDVVQEAFLKAYRSLGRVRSGAPFRPWLLRIVANEASNARRSAGRRTGLVLRVRDTGSDDEAPSPEEEALRHERRAELAAALARLGERDRLVLAYRWFAELSESEMAEAMGCRAGTVKSRLARAHERLRAELS